MAVRAVPEELKKAIRSILVSSPKGLNLLRLQVDYQKIIGTVLNYKEYGFHTLKQFVTAIPDTVRLVSNPQDNFITLYPVFDKEVFLPSALQKNQGHAPANTTKTQRVNINKKKKTKIFQSTADYQGTSCKPGTRASQTDIHNATIRKRTPGLEQGMPGLQTTLPGREPVTPELETGIPEEEPETSNVKMELPGLEPVLPGLEPAMPGLEPAMPGLEPAMPGLELAMPGLEPAMPGLELAMPGLEPAMPGLEPVMPGLEPATTESGLVPVNALPLPESDSFNLESYELPPPVLESSRAECNQYELEKYLDAELQEDVIVRHTPSNLVVTINKNGRTVGVQANTFGLVSKVIVSDTDVSPQIADIVQKTIEMHINQQKSTGHSNKIRWRSHSHSHRKQHPYSKTARGAGHHQDVQTDGSIRKVKLKMANTVADPQHPLLDLPTHSSERLVEIKHEYRVKSNDSEVGVEQEEPAVLNDDDEKEDRDAAAVTLSKQAGEMLFQMQMAVALCFPSCTPWQPQDLHDPELLICPTHRNAEDETMLWAHVVAPATKPHLAWFAEATRRMQSEKVHVNYTPQKRTCVANYQGEWFRGCVLDVQGEFAQVFALDYGNTVPIHVGSLRDLPQKYWDFPAQAWPVKVVGSALPELASAIDCTVRAQALNLGTQDKLLAVYLHGFADQQKRRDNSSGRGLEKYDF